MRHKGKTTTNRHLEARDREMIYGVHPVSAALANNARGIWQVWATQNMADRLNSLLQQRGITAAIVHPREIDKRAGAGAVHQGVLIEVAALPQIHLDEITGGGTVVLLDQVTDPHNVGAIMRSCAAFGVAALITTARHSPEGSAVLTKSASGAADLVPFIKVTNLARAMETLKDMGYCMVGLDSQAGEAVEQITLPGPYAIVLGAEGKGLRQLTQTNCDTVARLNLPGSLVSLNVSNAAALTLYALAGRK